MTSIVIAVVLALEGSSSPCSSIAENLEHEFIAAGMAMNVRSSWSSICERAVEALRSCPDTEALGYVALRALQLQFARRPAEHEALEQARVFAAKFPRSVRIATAKARLDTTVEAARSAVALDGRYPPAQIALSIALLESGDHAGARVALGKIANLGALDDGYATLARVAWAEGDVSAAMQAAQKQFVSAGGFEPGSAEFSARQVAHEILGLSYMKRGQPEKAAPHLLAADAASKDVAALLERPTPALRRALARQRRLGKR